MTLVCATHHQNVPILISDVLLSSCHVKEHATISTVENLDRISFTTKAKVRGLSSKLIILRARLSVGWSGTKLSADDVILHLNTHLDEEPTIYKIHVLLNSYFQYGAVDVSLVGSLVFETNAFFFNWEGATNDFSTSPYCIAGSGVAGFTDFLFPDGIAATISTESEPPVQAAVEWAVKTIGGLLAQEVLDGSNLKDHFGGGFDVVFFDGRSFRRLSKITQIFLGVEVQSIGIPLRMIIKTRATSISQTWSACAIRIDRADTEEMPLKAGIENIRLKVRHKVSTEAPLHPLDRNPQNDPDLKFIIVHITFLVKGKEFGAGCSIYLLPSPNIAVIYYPGVLVYRMSKDFHKDIARGVWQILDNATMRALVADALHRE